MVGGLALAGTWLMTRQVSPPARRFGLCLFAMVSLGAIAHASQAGYLQGRHLLLGVVVALAPAGLATEVLGARIALALLRSWRPGADGLPRAPNAVSSWAVAILALATIIPLTLRPLHASRSSYRAAATWLSQHTDDNSLVLDSHGLTGLYSGLPTKSYQSARRAFAHPHLAFVVVEQRELVSDSTRANTLRHLLTTSATEAARFDGPKGDSSHDVVVYRWQPARFAELVSPQTRIAGGDAMLNPLRR